MAFTASLQIRRRGFVGFEQMTRPFVIIDSAPFNRVRPGPEEDYEPPEAVITWGASSQFILPPVVARPGDDDGGGGGGLDATLPDNDSPTPVVNWNEVSRSVSRVRVENPEDPEQYVVIERIDAMTFETSTGVQVRMRFRNR